MMHQTGVEALFLSYVGLVFLDRRWGEWGTSNVVICSRGQEKVRLARACSARHHTLYGCNDILRSSSEYTVIRLKCLSKGSLY